MKRGCTLLASMFMLSNSAAAVSSLCSNDISSLSTCSPLHISGYIDTSYNYLVRSKSLTSGFYNRLYDITENGFTLQQAAIIFSVTPDAGLGGLFAAIAGRDAYSIAPYGINADAFGSDYIGLTESEAYLSYGISRYTFYAGQMLSLSGIEQYNYGVDENFSRSIIDGFAQPGSHLGLRVSNHYNDQLTLIAGLNNGWSTVQQPGNLNTGELGIKYIVPDRFKLVVDTYLGIQQRIPVRQGGNISNRYLLDTYGTWYVSDKLNFSMNYDYGIQNKAIVPGGYYQYAVWDGLAVYMNYHLMDQWQTSIRGEIYNDSDGYSTGVRQNWREITLTLIYNVTKQFMLRAETRHDFSNVNAFVNSNGFGASNNQQSYAMEAYYSFAI